MDHHDWILWKLTQEHRRDLLRQAEQERLARQAKSTGKRVYRALDWLGRELVMLGEHMQATHKAVITTAALHAAYHHRSMTHTPRDQS